MRMTFHRKRALSGISWRIPNYSDLSLWWYVDCAFQRYSLNKYSQAKDGLFVASSIIPGTEGSPRKRWKIYTLSRDSHNSPGLQISRKIPGSMYFALCNCNRAWNNEVIANAPQCGGPQSRRNTMKIRIIQTSLPLPGSRFTLKVLWNAQKPRVGGIVSWCSINEKGCRVEWKKKSKSLAEFFLASIMLGQLLFEAEGLRVTFNFFRSRLRDWLSS